MYKPDADSFLLSEAINQKITGLSKQNPEIKFLEIGCGSGIQLDTALDSSIKKENIYGVDINAKDVKHCRKKGFNVIKSDLFSEINSLRYWPKKFDLIVFNPPYLPFDKEKDSLEPKDSQLETTGGIQGSEIINKFLREAKSYLNENGKIFLLTSSLTREIEWEGWKKKKIAEKKLFFEKLWVWEVWKSNKDTLISTIFK